MGEFIHQRCIQRFYYFKSRVYILSSTISNVSGIFDIISHLMEQYFSGDDNNTTDYVIEGLLRSVIDNARVAIKNPEDYEARSNIM